MGADLVAAVVEIEKGKQPDWLAAQEVLNTITDDALWKVVQEVEGFEAPDGASKLALEAFGSDSFDPRTRVRDALANVISGWEGNTRLIVLLCGAKTDMLLAADSTHGDPVTEVTDIEYFVASGLAEAAGFLVAGRTK